MSAFICSDLHFSIIAYAIEGLNPSVNAQGLADKLKSINIESFNYRYNEKTRKTRCKLKHDGRNYSTADIIRLIQCWSYQSCEDGHSLDFLTMDSFLLSHFENDEIRFASNASDKWSV